MRASTPSTGAAVLILLAAGCGGRSAGPPDPEVVPAPPLTFASPAPPSAPSASRKPEPAAFEVTPEGELLVPGDVSFRVRPLAGPGSMGPSELTPESDEALTHVQKYLVAHPEQPIRIEGAVNVFKTSSGPNPGYAARLARLVARRLVELGVPCARVEIVGRLERDRNAPLQRVRFLAKWGPEAPDAREDPCATP